MALPRLFLLAPFLLCAQQQLHLEVVDPSGASMQASGRIQAVGSGFDRTFRTSPAGAHSIEGLDSGTYRLELTAPGFAPYFSTVEIADAAVSRRVVMSLNAPSGSLTVVGATPLSGADFLSSDLPAPVQAATHADLRNSGALDLSDFLNRRLNGVFVNEVQGNPIQPDVSYRGYTASPLLGTPQGLSVYMDGVRLNQPFGDIVSWDLIPRAAIAETSLMPGSNPVFGLNTLGGALSIRTKDGYDQPGTSLAVSGGSFGRKVAELEHGGSTAKGLDWYLAGNLFFEDGWRDHSPSSVRQFFGRIGRRGERTSVSASFSYANNALTGNGLQEQALLERDYSSVYTRPDFTGNKSPFFNLTVRHSPASRVTFSGNFYYRHIATRTLNGDINEDSLDQAVYQPSAGERAALAAAGFTGFPVSGESAANTPFPFWRCIAQSLLRDEPAEKCNGLINRSNSAQHNYGGAGQASWSSSSGGRRNLLTAGAAYDRSRVDFRQLSQLGYLDPHRGVIGVDSFADGVTGGDEDGVPFDTRVDLDGLIHTASVYATDTLSLDNRWNLTLSGRYNRTTVDNLDRIRPTEGSGSLTGRHVFRRFNPAAGITFRPASTVNLYFGYSEGNRAPTSIELGCADPEQPCKLPNAMAGDPPLHQVVTHTFEAGIRGGGAEQRVQWNAGWFRASNRDDILFVASGQTGFGYFRNFGRTLRQGLEAGANSRLGRVSFGGGYTFLDATFRSPEEVGGAGNSANEEALEGIPGTEGIIEIVPGNRIPFTPRHLLKAYATLNATSKLVLDFGVVGVSSSIARGNENNLHQPDGRYYFGPGEAAGYAVANAGARYQIHPRAQLFVQINNLFDRRYHTAAQLGSTGFTPEGSFIARPFPAIGGEFPLRGSTFFAPGAPAGAWGGLRLRF